MNQHVTLTVSVPEDRVADLYTFVARLHAKAEAPPVTDEEQLGTKDAPKQRTAAGFGPATVKKNYLGGISEYWRPFLDELAAHPDEWISWEELCKAIDLPPNRASGMLGAAERRCKLLPPYEKAYEHNTYWFRMPQSVAAVVQDVASKP